MRLILNVFFDMYKNKKRSRYAFFIRVQTHVQKKDFTSFLKDSNIMLTVVNASSDIKNV